MTDKAKTILSFDIGLKRTGVASGHSAIKSASPAGQLALSNGRFDWHMVDKLFAQWEPDLIVVGNPFVDGVPANPALKKAINRFKSHIQQNYKLPIVDVDERLTSSAANAELQGVGLSISKKTQLRDQIAACLILESYFNSLAN